MVMRVCARVVIGGCGGKVRDGTGRGGYSWGMLRADEGGGVRRRRGTERGLRNHGAALRGSSVRTSSWVVSVKRTL